MMLYHTDLPSLTEPTYWLGEPQPGLLEMVYQHEANPDPSFLFAQTSLAELQEHGPLLVSLSPQSGVLRLLKDAPDRFKGILLTTSVERSFLLAHLQVLLDISFASQRRAIFRYYDPVVASYFWPTIGVDEAAIWMGPIHQIFWYGGTWADKAEGKLQWHELTKPRSAKPAAHAGRYVLGAEQQQALINQSVEQFAFNWLRLNSPVPFPQLIRQIHAGIAAGHEDEASLTAWLDNQNRYGMERQG